jgi:alanine racemase
MFATSQISVDYQAYHQNVTFLKSHFGQKVKISSVVKGNAYGHGIELFVPMAEEVGIRHFSVFEAEEAFRVFNASKHRSTIMVMGFIGNEELSWAISNEIEFFVFDIGRLEAAIFQAKQLNKPAKIHIELETGLNRTGLTEEQVIYSLELIDGNQDYVDVVGFTTHYAGAESIANYFRVTKQIIVFNEFMEKFAHYSFLKNTIRHTACSAASMSYPETRMDMVRIGIMQYGFWPSKETFIQYVKSAPTHVDPLKRLISWKTKVMDIKEVGVGEFVGYGTTFMASQAMRIATVPIGYSHGFARSLSNQGRVIIRGKRLGVIGTINMNLLMIDLTECPEAQHDDEVVLIGEQGQNTISVSSFAELSDLLNYELLTRLPANTPRRIVNRNNTALPFLEQTPTSNGVH